MGKMQITIAKDEQKKAEVAAHFSGLTINEAVGIGKEINLEVTYRNGNQLVNFGRKLEQVTGTELDELVKAREAKAKAAEGKADKKK